MAHIPNLAKKIYVEYLTLTTTSAAAVSGNFTSSNIARCGTLDVAIQNISAVPAYICFGVSATVVADTTNSMYLPASGSISLTNVDFRYFSVIRVTDNVSVRITGIGG